MFCHQLFAVCCLRIMFLLVLCVIVLATKICIVLIITLFVTCRVSDEPLPLGIP